MSPSCEQTRYWKLTDQVPVKDDRGKPVLNAEGNKVYRTFQLERPRVFSAVAFNAEQIEGLPPLEIKAPEWDRHERAAAVLKASGIEIGYDPGQHAAYVDSWIKVLKGDPKEILRAARDADEITGYLLWLEKERLPANVAKEAAPGRAVCHAGEAHERASAATNQGCWRAGAMIDEHRISMQSGRCSVVGQIVHADGANE